MASKINVDMPILPSIEKKLEQYATTLENFSIYDYEKCQLHWERAPDPSELLYFEESPLSTQLKVQRNPFTGEIVDFHEVHIQAVGATAQNSMLMNRAPLPPNKAIRGSASYLPFLPGSFPSDSLNLPKFKEVSTTELLTIPPGFSKGLNFAADGFTVLKDDNIEMVARKIPEQKHVINLLELAQSEQNILGTWGDSKKESKENSAKNPTTQYLEEESIIPTEPLVLNISKAAPLNAAKGTEWAILLDTSKPVKDFENKIPNMARQYNFPLDPFQQLAILQLEKHNHVFVAAHTSAGKTVVAEYAIALSQQHKTRTIYTSPIKALSNQKYRDFRKEFEDVGLITGDFQINDKASCLIMTTEILRSMLYSGSDVIRELEFVIFDEVHYINDRERGHVWEQVMIMLPEHVCVVMLSATVPNPEKFADWLGRMHRKKVFVITTAHRPVPLQHFLYTGIDGKTKDQRYLLLKENQWCMEGYIQAKNSIPEQTDKRGSERRQFTEKQDKTLWSAFIDHLQRKDLLPAVVFAFSRSKCDRNARISKSVDLTTKDEKHRIHKFYEKCMKNLKEEDRNISQVKEMRDNLMLGIGVHHSGVLPIIKEIVEMLFEERLIKLLFATETFAMGVNMPARTVIFDSITKYDGKEWRTLEPAEYIQMAGRAGRRRQDESGTVIILCKNEVPLEIKLRGMMKHQPQSLSSQFRLTYAMVLTLLRINEPVEKMMSRSFLEADKQRFLDENKKKLEEVKKKIKETCKEELSDYLQPLAEYFDCAIKYLEHRKEFWNDVFHQTKVLKVMTAGRILVISHKNHINKLGMLLSISRSSQQYRVLILNEGDVQNCELDDKTDRWYKMLSLASPEIFCPKDYVSHDVVDICPLDILEITRKTIKADTEIIFRDWKNRQIPRFKNDPPGQTTSNAIQELHKLSLSSKENTLEFLDFIKDLHVDDSDLYDQLTKMYKLKELLHRNVLNTQIPNFIEQFSIVFDRKSLEKEKDDLEHSISGNSCLSEDYENRIQLLQHLKYVNKDNMVNLKGRVACEIGMNELIITEVVSRNVLKELESAEVAALLSTIVFQAKNRNQDKENLEKYVKEMRPEMQRAVNSLKEIHREIIELEERYNVNSEDIQDELNFGVFMVVFEWASKKTFADIMKYTDFQEGIVVRCIQQLNDTICDVQGAARIICNPELQNKMDEASKAIKRDIVFTASLYTDDETIAFKKT